MKERPILISAPMVRAILEGRKTQTRRVVRARNQDALRVSPYPRPPWTDGRPFYGWDGNVGHPLFCPYGAPDDRLWVREAWAAPHENDHLPPRLIPQDARIHYAATEDRGGLLWRPSIHMPRWASRITLEITDVRLQRLQDISWADAMDEGTMDWVSEQDTPMRHLPAEDARIAYKAMWGATRGRGSWDANPWVWALTFRRIEQQARAA